MTPPRGKGRKIRMARRRNKKEDIPVPVVLPDDVVQTLNDAKKSRQELEEKLDENAFADGLRKALKGE